MTTNLISFDFDEQPLQVLQGFDDPWFVATDVARILGYSETAAMLRSLDEDEQHTHTVSRLEGNRTVAREVAIISESGLYATILRSQRPEARAFRKWVTSEVLPSIRKTGTYTLDPDVKAFIAERNQLTVADFFAAFPGREDTSDNRRAVARDLRRQGFVRVYQRRES